MSSTLEPALATVAKSRASAPGSSGITTGMTVYSIGGAPCLPGNLSEPTSPLVEKLTYRLIDFSIRLGSPPALRPVRRPRRSQRRRHRAQLASACTSGASAAAFAVEDVDPQRGVAAGDADGVAEALPRQASW